MGFGSHYVISARFCFSTEDYNEYIKKHYHNNDDDENIIPEWFHLTYCDVCKTYRV